MNPILKKILPWVADEAKEQFIEHASNPLARYFKGVQLRALERKKKKRLKKERKRFEKRQRKLEDGP